MVIGWLQFDYILFSRFWTSIGCWIPWFIVLWMWLLELRIMKIVLKRARSILLFLCNLYMYNSHLSESIGEWCRAITISGYRYRYRWYRNFESIDLSVIASYRLSVIVVFCIDWSFIAIIVFIIVPTYISILIKLYDDCLLACLWQRAH